MIVQTQTVSQLLFEKRDQIDAWLAAQTTSVLPLYSSVDIRNAGFKSAVVDHNLFPAGFNNLSGVSMCSTAQILKHEIEVRVPGCQKLVLLCEEHTRNLWYLENVRILSELLGVAGFEVTVATFFSDHVGPVSLETATGAQVTISPFGSLQVHDYDLVILNNDLTGGIPDDLRSVSIPILPSMCAGWHSRLKSQHFLFVNDLLAQLADLIGLDPWLISTQFRVVESVDINHDVSRDALFDQATALFADIQSKYDAYGIDQTPFVFMKADSGTYGMGIKMIESPDEILSLNRKNRNKLAKGKQSQVINRFILQEGVPSNVFQDDKVAEACLYHISDAFVGGFYRMHEAKTNRDNLNSKGMVFRRMCVSGDCESLAEGVLLDAEGIHLDEATFYLYRVLAQVSGLAASKEIAELEKDCH